MMIHKVDLVVACRTLIAFGLLAPVMRVNSAATVDTHPVSVPEDSEVAAHVGGQWLASGTVSVDQSIVLLSTASGRSSQLVWTSGFEGLIRIKGAFLADAGMSHVILQPPSGIELAGGVCETGGSEFAYADRDWMGLGPGWSTGDDAIPGLVKAKHRADFGLQLDDVGGHTPTSPAAPNRDASWIKWTAPAAMRIRIDGGVWASFHRDRSAHFLIRKNSTDLYGGFRREGADAVMTALAAVPGAGPRGPHPIPSNATSQHPDAFSLVDVDVQAGDQLSFLVNSNGSSDHPEFGCFFGIRIAITDQASGRKWNLADAFASPSPDPGRTWSWGQLLHGAGQREVRFDSLRQVRPGDQFEFRAAARTEHPSSVRLQAKISSVPQTDSPGRMIPANLPDRIWETFPASGYDVPVTGVLYRNFKGDQESGMPLGGVGTGALYLEKGATLGYSSIFGHYSILGGPVNLPFLGLHCGGETWILSNGHTKNYAANAKAASSPDLQIEGTRMADTVEYWGHYPIANVEYQTGAPVGVSLRAWSPFIPGDAKSSNTPAAVFEVNLCNLSTATQMGMLTFSFPGFAEHAPRNTAVGWPNLSAAPVLPQPAVARQQLAGEVAGVHVEDRGWGMSYVLAALDQPQVRTGDALGADGSKWSAMHKGLPVPEPASSGSSVGVDFKLAPREQTRVCFVLAWYTPEWEGNGNPGTGGTPRLRSTGQRFRHMYATRFTNAVEVAKYMAAHHEQLLRRIIAWQSTLYSEAGLPPWLSDVLINQLYYFATCSLWAAASPPLDWCRPEDGAFALMEAPRSCPQITEVINAAIAGGTLEIIFPDLALSRLRWLKHYISQQGEISGAQGTWADLAGPGMPEDYQQVMLTPGLMSLLNLYYRRTGDEAMLREFYPLAKRFMLHGLNHRPAFGDSQIISMPEPNRHPDGRIISPHEGGNNVQEWFEDRLWRGYVVHPGGFRMAAAQIFRVWAQRMDDQGIVQELDRLIEAGHRALDQHLWKMDHYIAMNDPESGEQVDGIFLPALNGDFFAAVHGVSAVFPSSKSRLQLEQIKLGRQISRLGLPPLYFNVGGSPWVADSTGYLTGQHIFTNHQITQTAITFMQSDQQEIGLELLKLQYENISCRWGYTWDGANACSGNGDTGERTAGWDYYFNWVVWMAPLALAGQDISEFCQPGALGDRLIRSGLSE